MTKEEFKKITQKGKFVAWKPCGQDEYAYAYMVSNAWFEVALNLYTHKDLGEKSPSGIYERHWGGDEVHYDEYAEYRLMTIEEVVTYIGNIGECECTLISKKELFERFIGEMKYRLLDDAVDFILKDFINFIKLMHKKYVK